MTVKTAVTAVLFYHISMDKGTVFSFVKIG